MDFKLQIGLQYAAIFLLSIQIAVSVKLQLINKPSFGLVKGLD